MINSNIYSLWKNLVPAKNKDSFNLKQFNQTNLWLYKSYNDCFGFIITNTFAQLQHEYKNIDTDWKAQLVDLSNGGKLSNCLIIESNSNIDSRLFCLALSSIFDVEINHRFKVQEVEFALSKIEAITLKQNDEYNEVIGVWGELFLINELLNKSSSFDSKQEIISAWEGLNTRTKIDFRFNSKNTIIEVKTTAESIRFHHFNSLDQVLENDGIFGYLSSICITLDENGTSNFDLVKSVKNELHENLIVLFDEKLKIRGKVCFNNNYKFQINQYKNWEFFKFDIVPRPIIGNDILGVEWDANLENKSYLTDEEKTKLIDSIVH